MTKIETISERPSMMVNETIRSPRYHQVYSILRGWIFDGTYQPGAKLPPESDLCEEFGVSRITSRKAIDLLVQENLIVRVQGKGTYVVDDLGDAPNIGDMEQLIRKTEKLSKKSKVERIEIKQVAGDEEICRDLQIPKGSAVTEVSFVRFMDGKPTGYRVSYLPADRGLEITAKDLRSHQMFKILEGKGVHLSGAHQLLGACLADAHKAALLNTTVGAPLVRIRLVTFDEDAKPVERSTAYYLAERYEHHVYLKRGTGKEEESDGDLKVGAF
ncbi:MAG: GntR family transcriptional regulator [Rhodospirillaceae bacterium]|nr:GntR family transcriptional regulator [Rhodospirillaceae bacterium]